MPPPPSSYQHVNRHSPPPGMVGNRHSPPTSGHLLNQRHSRGSLNALVSTATETTGNNRANSTSNITTAIVTIPPPDAINMPHDVAAVPTDDAVHVRPPSSCNVTATPTQSHGNQDGRGSMVRISTL